MKLTFIFYRGRLHVHLPGAAMRFGETRGEDMDIQLIIVILCIIAAAYYFGRRVYTAVRKGKCGCCDGGCDDGKKNSCGCTPNDAEAQRLENKRLKFDPKK